MLRHFYYGLLLVFYGILPFLPCRAYWRIAVIKYTYVKIFQIFVSFFSISIRKITKTLFFFNNNRSITHTPVLNTLKMKKNGLKIWNFGLEEYYLCQYLYWDSFQTLCHLLFSEKVMEMKFSRNFS